MGDCVWCHQLRVAANSSGTLDEQTDATPVRACASTDHRTSASVSSSEASVAKDAERVGQTKVPQGREGASRASASLALRVDVHALRHPALELLCARLLNRAGPIVLRLAVEATVGRHELVCRPPTARVDQDRTHHVRHSTEIRLRPDPLRVRAAACAAAGARQRAAREPHEQQRRRAAALCGGPDAPAKLCVVAVGATQRLFSEHRSSAHIPRALESADQARILRHLGRVQQLGRCRIGRRPTRHHCDQHCTSIADVMGDPTPSCRRQ
eukprot:706165-Prymnesium_polylepis.1